MSTRPTDLVEVVSGASDDSFLLALGRIHDISPAEAPVFVLDVVRALARTSALPEQQKDERLSAVLQYVPIAPAVITTIVDEAHTLSPGIRNVLARHLPPADRRKLSATPKSAAASTSLQTGALKSESRQAPRSNLDHAGRPDAFAGESAADISSCSSVILLSSLPNQDANKVLLQDSDFGGIYLNSVEKLREDMRSSADICGFIVDASILNGLDADAQNELLSLIASYSSFAWIRIDDRGLRLGHPHVEMIVRKARCQSAPVAAQNLSIQPDGSLRAAELDYLVRARDVLRTRASVRFIPGEISDDEARLLIAAAREHAQERRFQSDIRIESLETRFLQGGKSGARIGIVRVNRSGACVVAKIDSRTAITEEIRRFRTYIQEWDNELQPAAFVHGSAAVILFGLVSRGVGSDNPAPMLADRLEDLWNLELFGADQPHIDRTAEALRSVLESSASMLLALNRRVPINRDFVPLGNPVVDPYLEQLESRGGGLGFSAVAIKARRMAAEKISALASAAVIHGDVHLRNILVRGDRDVHLIDYAGSGPGHPAADLARLELALYLGCMRQTDSEQQFTSLQRAVSLERQSLAMVTENFPSTQTCALNRTCMAGVIAARDAAAKAIATHGGNHSDYLAVKYLIAWQNLLMAGHQNGLARSIIEALAPEIVGDSLR